MLLFNMSKIQFKSKSQHETLRLRSVSGLLFNMSEILPHMRDNNKSKLCNG